MMWRLYVVAVPVLWLCLVTESIGSKKEAGVAPGHESGPPNLSTTPPCSTLYCQDGASHNSSAPSTVASIKTETAPRENSHSPSQNEGGETELWTDTSPTASQTLASLDSERTSALQSGSIISSKPAHPSDIVNASAATTSIQRNDRNNSSFNSGSKLYLSTVEVTPLAGKPSTTPLERGRIQPERAVQPDRPPRPIQSTNQYAPVFLTNPRNRTVEFGDEVTLRCRVRPGAGDMSMMSTTITWEFNGMPVGDLPHWTVKDRPLQSTIKIKGASLEHGGRYRCLASTEQGSTVSDMAFLVVEMPPTFIKGPDDHKVRYGTMLNLSCEVQAFPKPLSSWWKDRMPLKEWTNYDSIQVNITETADYTCLYKNEVGGKPKLAGRHGRVTVIGERPNYCAIYNGAVCGDYLPSNRQLFVDGSDEEPMVLGEELSRIFEGLSMTQRRKECQRGLKELMCHATHPDCTLTPGYAAGKPICRRDCEQVQDSCENWSSLVNRNWGDPLSDRLRFLEVTSCSHLPETRCTKLWQESTDTPPTQKKTPTPGHPTTGAAPTTMRPHTRRVPGTIGKHEVPQASTNMLLILVISIPLAIGGVIILIAVAFAYKKSRDRAPFKLPKNIDLSGMQDNPMYGKDFKKSHNPHLAYLEYDRNRVIFEKDIGEGAFGRVFKAIAPKLVNSEPESIVAVKVLKGTADRAITEYFNREAQMIAMFNHDNIIRLLGVCFVGKPLCLLLEYMSEGDLEDFLHAKSPHQANNSRNTGPGEGLKTYQKLNIARQVASGMVYLNERRFVHRDIATRNCLVNSGMVVKISDFGLARYLGHKESFRGHKEEHIPIRWTAPEALWDYQFTFASDVWSFGVLLWELFSYAEQPYVNLSHEDVFLHTRRGYRLECSDKTPTKVYKMMEECWQSDPTSRPRFTQVLSSLSDMEYEWLANGEEA